MRLAGWRRRRRKHEKDAILETRLFQHRALIAAILVAAGLLTLLGRMAYLQVIAHQQLYTLADSNRMRLEPIPPVRGLIFDRNGVRLAENLPSHRLEVVPERAEDLELTLTELGQLVSFEASDLERFRKLRRQLPPYSGVPLKFRLTETEVNRLAVELHRLSGVDIKADLTRHYPFGAVAAHLIGYVGRIDERELQRIDVSEYRGSSHIGKTGVEKAYEKTLHGRVGRQQVETNARGRVQRIVPQQAAVAGSNIHLSIDIRLQQVAERALGEYSGAVVALDPRNGEVLALASMPGFDPNLFVNGIGSEAYAELANSPERPLFNRAVFGAYPPGSTIKPFMALAGLELGQTTTSRRLYCPGHYRLPGRKRKFRDWRRGGHGSTHVGKAISQSCDVYFYDLARQLGIDKMHAELSHFGLGQPTGIDLVGEKSGLLPSQEWKRSRHNDAWYAGDTVVVGIGQGYLLTTPLQLAHATATLSMNGRPFQPRVVLGTELGLAGEINRTAVKPQTPVPIRDPANWRHVIAAMVEVVHGQRGTARRINPGLGYTVAGKTGTAQVFSLDDDQEYDAEKLDRRLHDHGLFIAFAPAADPTIAVAVLAEHSGSGSAGAAPIARQVLDAHLVDEQTPGRPYQTTASRGPG